MSEQAEGLVGNAFLDTLEKTLAHYGVKGMRWGRRKSRDSGSSGSSEPSDVTIKSRPGKIETSGGKNQPPSEDAKKAAAYRQKAKASSIHALSNQEIKVLVERMNLEAQYSKAMAANAPQKSAGRKFLDNFIAGEKDTLLKGKKTKTQGFVEMAVEFHKGRAAKTAARAAGAATSKSASKTAAKLITAQAGHRVVQSYVIK